MPQPLLVNSSFFSIFSVSIQIAFPSTKIRLNYPTIGCGKRIESIQTIYMYIDYKEKEKGNKNSNIQTTCIVLQHED